MKNIHILPTDKPSKLIFYSTLLNEFQLLDEPIEDWERNKNIYITSDEHLKPNDFYFDFQNQKVKKCETGYYNKGSKKIILTDNKDLITDGVQAIDDEFLEWFVKNPSCEYVKVEDYGNLYNFRYLILIPKEESKQETLEEARVNSYIDFAKSNEDVSAYSFIAGWDKGAKWQQERMYSEEDLIDAFNEGQALNLRGKLIQGKEWFEQFKNK